MISPEERQEIIREAVEKAVEKALLVLPDTVGSLMMDHIAMNKLNRELYKEHPEFKDHKDAVVSVIEAIDGKNPLLDYKDKLGKAVPEIRKRIETMKSLNMETVKSNPSREYEPLSMPKIEKQHGEL